MALLKFLRGKTEKLTEEVLKAAENGWIYVTEDTADMYIKTAAKGTEGHIQLNANYATALRDNTKKLGDENLGLSIGDNDTPVYFEQGKPKKANLISIKQTLFAKMDKENPTGTGYFALNSLGKKGEYSFAAGANTQASGEASFAVGLATRAVGIGSNVMGVGSAELPMSFLFSTENPDDPPARGVGNHAEGILTQVAGAANHAEGKNTLATSLIGSTIAVGNHAEGLNTFATLLGSHAEGVGNLLDLEYGDGSNLLGSNYTIDADQSTINENTKILQLNTVEGLMENQYFGFQTEIDGIEQLEIGKILEIDYENSQIVVDGITSIPSEDTNLYLSGAIGIGAHSEGVYTFAGANITEALTGGAHAEGLATYAYDTCTHAEGAMTQAIGVGAHAEGEATIAFGNVSHAEGTMSQAEGDFSHAEGQESVAVGQGSHSEGGYTLAEGLYSHSEGNFTRAEGMYSHAEGGDTLAEGNFSHAEGTGTIAVGSYSHVQGKYNVEDMTSAHIVGNGTSTTKSNAHTLDWDGNAWFAGDVYVGSTSGTNKDSGSVKLIRSDDIYKNNNEGLQAGIIAPPAEGGGTTKYFREDGSWIDPLETTLTLKSFTKPQVITAYTKGANNLLYGITTKDIEYPTPPSITQGTSSTSVGTTIDAITNIAFDAITNSYKLDKTAYTIPSATSTSKGFMSAADKQKLDGIATGATANTGTVTSITAGTGLSGGTITTSGTINLATSGVTAGTYGPSAAVTGSDGTIIKVPQITVDSYGRVTSVTERTYTSVNTDSGDTKVTQAYDASTNANIPLLFSATSGITSTASRGATTAKLNNKFYVNPSTGGLYGTSIYGAVWNDYAEYREGTKDFEPGRVICENGDDTLSLATERLQPGANVVSDTFGFAIGETDKCKTPVAVSGRVLVYPYEDRNSYKPGDAVCAAPNGTVSKMTREEIREYPERIIGTVSAIPSYEIWGTGNVKVNGRIWIKIK